MFLIIMRRSLTCALTLIIIIIIINNTAEHSQLCSAWVRLFRRLLVEMVDWCASRLAKLICSHFDGKQSRESVDLPLTCHPSPSLTSFAFRSSEDRRLLLDLNPYGSSDPLGMSPLFLKRTADVLSPRPSVVFRRLVRLGSFPACWRQANVTPIQRVRRPPLLPITARFP